MDSPWERAVEEASAAWPGIVVPRAVFVTWIHERLPPGAAFPDALAKVHVEDLYLAAACGLGNARAAATLDRIHLQALARVLATTGLDPAARDDLVQSLRQRLLLGIGGRPPEIANYAGRGRLGAWLRMIAVREAVRVRRRGEREAAGVAATSRVAGDPATTLDARYLRSQLRQPMRDAIARGIAALDPRDRRLLQLRIIEGVPARTLARRFGVHESTVSRWFDKAFAALRRLGRAELRAVLEVPPRELESILRGLDGQFTASTGAVWPGTRESTRGTGEEVLQVGEGDGPDVGAENHRCEAESIPSCSGHSLP